MLGLDAAVPHEMARPPVDAFAGRSNFDVMLSLNERAAGYASRRSVRSPIGPLADRPADSRDDQTT